MEFALKYARALDHSEDVKAGNTLDVSADVFISVLRSYYGRLNLRPGDLLEPDFLMLDADSACLSCTQSQVAQWSFHARGPKVAVAAQ